MPTPRVLVACLWGALALFALYSGIAHGSEIAWRFFFALIPPLIVFIWWMIDRTALERRIRRLEASSEIGDERRVVAHTDLSKAEHKLSELETRVAQVEDNDARAMKSAAHRPKQSSEQGSGTVGKIISINPK
jgi:hypothetical protein